LVIIKLPNPTPLLSLSFTNLSPPDLKPENVKLILKKAIGESGSEN